jgi:hypothetical protein
MHPPTQSASHSLPTSRKDSRRTRPTEDVVYQIVTLAAILLVLGSLWVF